MVTFAALSQSYKCDSHLINTGLQPGDQRTVDEIRTFQRFRSAEKPLKRYAELERLITGLKPGVNDNPVAGETPAVRQRSQPPQEFLNLSP